MIELEKQARQNFQLQFKRNPDIVVKAPGRINIIGEHTDYTGGFVLPAAIENYMVLACAPNTGNSFRLHSSNFKETVTFSSEIKEKNSSHWSNYFKGVLQAFQNRGFQVPAIDVVLLGNVPQGAGLSSSAAYEVACAFLFNELCQAKLSSKELALIAQESEVKYIGVACGIMDQLVSACAQKDNALLLDCSNLAIEQVPLKLEDHGLEFVIIHSGVERQLENSAYNQRRKECEEALALLKSPNYRSLNNQSLNNFRQTLDSPIVNIPIKRARHIILENERVLACVQALQHNDYATVGKLMKQSHNSLKDDFEVSLRSVDLLVNLLNAQAGVLGSRMIGAGFGGCVLAIAKVGVAQEIEPQIKDLYFKQTKLAAQFMIVKSGNGAGITAQTYNSK